MPRPITKYLCNFKCGTHAMPTEARAIRHEAHCRKNPVNRTCDTCKFYELHEDGCDHPELPGCPSEYWCWHQCNHPLAKDGEFTPFSETSVHSKVDLPPKVKFCSKWNGGEYPMELQVLPNPVYALDSEEVPQDLPF